MDEQSDPSSTSTPDGPRRTSDPHEVTTAGISSSNDGRGASARRDGAVVLRDGSTVRIRAMRAADESGLLALLQSLSEDSRWMRFYSLPGESVLAAEAHREANMRLKISDG